MAACWNSVTTGHQQHGGERSLSDQQRARIDAPQESPQQSSREESGGVDQEAVWLLRSRGCWEIAAALLEPQAAHSPQAAVDRAELLIEQCLFTGKGWAAAEGALRLAEAGARTDEERSAAACARGSLAYNATLLRVHDRLDEAQAALGRASTLLPPNAQGRARLDFRRGLIAENLLKDPVSARTAYRRAHAGAEQHHDDLLLSYTWRHLASIAQQDGNLAGARHGFAESLRLREETGFTIGIAPALAALAEVSPAAEAAQLRAESARLVRAFGNVPVWLAQEQPGRT
jgi:tetratricopeptide (TPR) repeat protein